MDFALKEKDSWVNGDVQGQVYKLGNLEQQWTADKPQQGNLESQWVARKYQYGLIDHELDGGDKPRYADVPVESIGVCRSNMDRLKSSCMHPNLNMEIWKSSFSRLSHSTGTWKRF